MANVALTPLGRALPVALLAALGLAAPASADPPAARAAAEAAKRVFLDWRIVCAAAGCAARAEVAAQDGAAVLAAEAAAAGGGAALVLSTPLPLFLPDGLLLGLGDAPLRAIPWRTCGPAGCEAEAPLDPALLAGLERERAAEVTLTLEDGLRVRLPLSLMGFSAAWEALGAPPPAPAPDGGPAATPATSP